MRILVVGSLSWNPERIASLHQAGHSLWGLWGRSMAWDQGPYPMLEGVVSPVRLDRAVATIREQAIDCVYSLFQSYPSTFWGPATSDVDPDFDVWDLLRVLLRARRHGEIDVPFVHHYGFDVLQLDADVVRALDGHVFCNREKLTYWTAPEAEGGCGLDLFGTRERWTFADGDQPSAAFMTDDFSPRLSDATGELHTVCLGRPVGIDVIAAAKRGIHVHVYGNHHDDVVRALSGSLRGFVPWRHRRVLRRCLHVHPSRQVIGASAARVRDVKARWVSEFSRYDAGWSYIGTPGRWRDLDERAAIPNRLGTYLLAGLPIIADRRPGAYRYEEMRRLGAAIDLADHDYDQLAEALRDEVVTRERSACARAARAAYAFETTVPTLIGVLQQACARYARDREGARQRFVASDAPRIEFAPPRRARSWVPGRLIGSAIRSRRRARWLRGVLEAPEGTTGLPHDVRDEARPRRIAVLERFDDPSRRCVPAMFEGRVELHAYELRESRAYARYVHRGHLRALCWLFYGAGSFRLRLRAAAACWRQPTLRASAFLRLPSLCDRLDAGAYDELACFSSRGFPLAVALARLYDRPMIETLDRCTQYFGEFAFELQAVVPYAYWLHQQGRLVRTSGADDTRCLYFFSEDHEVRPVGRRYVPVTEYSTAPLGQGRFDAAGFPRDLDTRCWSPPPYKARFHDPRFIWDRPTCVVCNKTSDESYLKAAERKNAIETNVLLELVGRLRTRYQVVYDRPRSTDIVDDHQSIQEVGDIEAVTRAFPDVLTIQALHMRHPELTFNELQLRVFAGCERFVSVVGGSSYLASLFGGTNVVFARGGWEVDCGAFERWFDRFSGARVIAVNSPAALLAAVDSELLRPFPCGPRIPSG